LSGPEDGTGCVTVTASASVNSTDLLTPESIWLENAKNDLLFDRYDVAIIEALGIAGQQSLLAKFKLPQGVDQNFTGTLVLDYIVPSGIPTADLTLLLDCFQLELDNNLANAPGQTVTSTFSVDSGDASKLIRQEITLSKIVLKANSNLVIEVSRDSTDVYTGNFNILNTRLRYRSTLV